MSTLQYTDAVSGKVLTDRRYPIAAGQGTLAAFTCLMLVAGKLYAFDSGADSESESDSGSGDAPEAHSILVRETDASSETYADYIVRADSFNSNKLVLVNELDGVDDVRETLRRKGIYLRAWNPSEGS